MATRAILSGKSHFLLLSLLLSGGFSAQAASFDCQKAATGTERAICANDILSAKDEAIADLYQRLMAVLPQQEAVALRTDQRSWLKQRSACSGDVAALPACLTPLFTQRESELTARLHKAQRTLDADIATIPAHPAQAAARLRQYADPLAQAWLVWLHQFAPASGVGAQEAQRAESAASAALKANDNFAWSVWQDVRNDPKTSRDETVLMLLRMSIEQSGYDAEDRPWVHCFVFSGQGEAVWQAFGPLYGSSRDGSAPICPPQGGLFEQDAWKYLRNQIAAPESTVGATAGTIRFASFAAWRLFALRATLSPQHFLNPTAQAGTADDADDADDAVQRIRDWTDEKVWPATQRQLTLAAIEPARQSTARWLQLERGFSAADAQIAAENIVRIWLKQHLDYLAENSDSE